MSESDRLPAGILPDTDIRLLAAVRHSLRAHISAEVVSEMARTACEFSINLLDHVLARHTGVAEILRQQIGRESTLLRRSATLLLKAGVIDTSESATVIALADDAAATQGLELAALEALHLRIQTALEGFVPHMAAPCATTTCRTAPQSL